MKILCWNVNGIRAVAKKNFWEWFQKENADIVCLQEPKAIKKQVPHDLQNPPGYTGYWHTGKPGYAGTVTYSKIEAEISINFFNNIPMFHEEGRVVETRFKNFILLNLYFPNGGTRVDGTEMLSYKLKFYEYFLNYINNLRDKGHSIIACGDFNICHTEIDIARPKENANSIGFLPVERAWISKIIENGYVDVFRYFNPYVKNAYTWWSYRAGARQKNIGWRIDYFIISPDLVDKIKSIEHQTDIIGSDHCPLKLEL